MHLHSIFCSFIATKLRHICQIVLMNIFMNVVSIRLFQAKVQSHALSSWFLKVVAITRQLLYSFPSTQRARQASIKQTKSSPDKRHLAERDGVEIGVGWRENRYLAGAGMNERMPGIKPNAGINPGHWHQAPAGVWLVECQFS